LKSTCQLDVHRFPVTYLTCTEFKNGDFPWLKEDQAPRVVPAKREYKPGGNEIARRNLEVAKRFQERGLSVEGNGDDDDLDLDENALDDDDIEDQSPSAEKRARVD
jgi:hypothetical protein